MASLKEEVERLEGLLGAQSKRLELLEALEGLAGPAVVEDFAKRLEQLETLANAPAGAESRPDIVRVERLERAIEQQRELLEALEKEIDAIDVSAARGSADSPSARPAPPAHEHEFKGDRCVDCGGVRKWDGRAHVVELPEDRS